FEELELDLASARLLGQLSDVPGHAESICVSAFVYALGPAVGSGPGAVPVSPAGEAGAGALIPVVESPIVDDPVLKPNHEIREAFWSPLHHLADPARQAMKPFTYLERTMPLPTVRLLDDPRAPVLWGITYKFMDEFMTRIARPIPFMPWADTD
ncbi:hypothetical protein K2X89_15210, partial [Myxococcota bacterium]|nr:hypothetical protein [Myxococcota bacterium]